MRAGSAKVLSVTVARPNRRGPGPNRKHSWESALLRSMIQGDKLLPKEENKARKEGMAKRIVV
jgi:hypothetical protein